MLIAYNTDAPLYHRPDGTAAMIIANTLVYFVLGSGLQPDLEDYILWHGDGLHPLQWLTTNFLHADFLHLFGNMLFLWTFGLIVEGKVGPWRFLAIYVGIGVVQAALQQLSMLGSVSYDDLGGRAGALGASSAIYGLMAIALVWAPRNELECFYWYVRAGICELSLTFFVGFYLSSQLLIAYLTGFAMSSEVLHLWGAAVGFPIGIGMVLLKWVDCEGWDAISVLKGTNRTDSREEMVFVDAPIAIEVQPKTKRRKPALKPLVELTEDEEQLAVTAANTAANTAPAGPRRKSVSAQDLLKRIQHASTRGNLLGAIRDYERLKAASAKLRLPENELLPLTDFAFRQQDWDAAIPLMEECVERFPEKCNKLRLRLAELQLKHQGNPERAMATLDAVIVSQLSPAHRQLCEELQQACQWDLDTSTGDSSVASESDSPPAADLSPRATRTRRS